MKKLFVVIILIGAVAAVYFFTGKRNDIRTREDMDNKAPLSFIMKIESNSFSHNEKIPSQFTCDGENINPQFSFRDVPEGTKTIALISDDPDAPGGTWVHWLVWNIDPATIEIREGNVPQGTVEGTTSFGKTEYGGPCPPSGTHRYFFKLYALDTALDLGADADKTALENVMKGHIIDSAEIIGLYESR